jgi:transcriptional regulator with XRE-family HTH domain
MLIQHESEDTTLARAELLSSLRDQDYRRQFVAERVRSSMALQIRALREQRKMSQTALGEELGMAQTWVSKLENPDYGKMTVATLLRLADAFDTDLEIKFRPFSTTLHTLPRQGREYFVVPSFADEFSLDVLSSEEQVRGEQVSAFELQRRDVPSRILGGSARDRLNATDAPRMGAASDVLRRQIHATR